MRDPSKERALFDREGGLFFLKKIQLLYNPFCKSTFNVHIAFVLPNARNLLKKIIDRYYPNNEYIDYFILDKGVDERYNEIKRECWDQFDYSYRIPDTMMTEEKWTFCWLPLYKKTHFHAFIKVNLLFFLYTVSIKYGYNDLRYASEEYLYSLMDTIYAIENGYEKETSKIPHLYYNQPFKKIQKTLYFSPKHGLWKTIALLKNGGMMHLLDDKKGPKYKSVKKLMFLLKIRAAGDMMKLQKNYTFCLSIIIQMALTFLDWKDEAKGRIYDIWELVPFLNYCYYKNFPTDQEMRKDPTFLKYIPLCAKSADDQIFNGHHYILKALEEDVFYSNKKREDPIVFILKIALPKRHVQKNSYMNVNKYYRKIELVRLFLNSCIINTIVGCYPGMNNENSNKKRRHNHCLFKDLHSIFLLLKFYNNFVLNPDKPAFIQNLCKNQAHLKCIIRQFIIYTIKKNPSIPILKKIWESELAFKREEVSSKNKLPLNFKNFVYCNRKNVYSYRKYYFFGESDKKIMETVKKEKDKKMEQIIYDELKKNLQNDLIIYKIFQKDVDQYLMNLSVEMLNNIHTVIYNKGLSLWEKIQRIHLPGRDIEILKKIIKTHTNSPRKRIGLILEDLSILGKTICFHFFNQLSKFKKIQIKHLNPGRQLFQHLIQCFEPNYFEKVHYTTCCKFPRICNKAGNQTSVENESGLHDVCIGLNNRLYCSKHYKKKKKKEEKNHDKILDLLKDDIIFNLKKIFKYIVNREQTFQLYQYLLTGNKTIPNWFNHEKDDDLYKPFTQLTRAQPTHYTPITHGYLKPKYFYLPVTHDRKIAKEHLIKLISSNKIQLKTIFNNHTKHLIQNIIFDHRVFHVSLIGQYLVIDTKKKSKKKKKKKKDEKKKKKRKKQFKKLYFYNKRKEENEENEEEQANKKKKELNKNYKRVFCLCDYCGELKLFNPLYYSYIYTCKECMYIYRRKQVEDVFEQYPKMLIDSDNHSFIHWID